MKTDLFSEAMNHINDKYYEEALSYTGKQKTAHHWVRWAACAACFALAAIAASSVLPNYLKPKHSVPDQPNGITALNPSKDTTENPDGNTTSVPDTEPGEPKISVRMDQIALNEISALADTARRYYDPELYDTAVWDQESAEDYYGKSLIPTYIPEDLTSIGLGGLKITDKGGAVKEDTVYQDYYLIHGCYEDGSPMRIDPEHGVFAARGISICASKIGLLRDCCYLLPENEVKTSDIGGITVTFGYRSMSYGPYDPETHEPSGYYDLYVAEFECDGIKYEIISEQLPLEELVKVTASIICGEEVDILPDGAI